MTVAAHTARSRRGGWRALIASAGLAAAAVTFGSLAGSTAAGAAGGTGWLRLAHFSPNTPAVDVYLYSFHDPTAKIKLTHVAYGTISPYEPVPSGDYTVAMRLAGASSTSPPVLSASVRVAPGTAFTVAGLGPAKGLRLQVLRDRLTTAPGTALVRIIQASLKQHLVTFTAGQIMLARKLPFGSVTSYRTVPSGTWEVRAAGASEHTASAIRLAPGTIHTIVLLDDPGKLKLDDLVDAAGSGLVPAGAPGTGFGGTAPGPGPSPVPWLIVTGLGALAACAGGARVLRSRGRLASGAGSGRRSRPAGSPRHRSPVG